MRRMTSYESPKPKSLWLTAQEFRVIRSTLGLRSRRTICPLKPNRGFPDGLCCRTQQGRTPAYRILWAQKKHSFLECCVLNIGIFGCAATQLGVARLALTFGETAPSSGWCLNLFFSVWQATNTLQAQIHKATIPNQRPGEIPRERSARSGSKQDALWRHG